MARFPNKQSTKGDSLISGRQPLVEAMESGREIDKIFIQKNVSGESIGRIRELAREKNIPIQHVPVEKLNALTRGNHQGVVALAASITYQDLEQTIQHVFDEGQTPLFVMLDGVTDIRNIGAIARTSVCCGAQAIIIPQSGVGALNEDAVKTSAGALQKINVCRVASLMKAVDLLHLRGIRVFASEMKAVTLITSVDFTGPSCIVVGSEEKGVYPALLNICDEQFSIPMPGKFESLNVSVAAGIMLYETVRQRLQKGGN